MVKYEKYIFLYFEKNSNKTLMGMKIHFEISTNRANFTKNFKFLPKTRTYCTLGWIYFFAYFSKSYREVLGKTSVDGNLIRTSVGGNLGTISSNILKLGDVVHQDRYFYTLFLKRRRKVLGRTSVGGNLRRSSVGRYFERISPNWLKIKHIV